MPDRPTQATGMTADVAEICRIRGIGSESISRRVSVDPPTTLPGRAQMSGNACSNLDRVNALDAGEDSSKRTAGHASGLANAVREGREEVLDRLLDTGRPEA